MLPQELGSQQAAYVPYDLSIGTIGLERLAETLLRIYVAQGKEVEWMCEMVEHDLGDSADPNIIFRYVCIHTFPPCLSRPSFSFSLILSPLPFPLLFIQSKHCLYKGCRCIHEIDWMAIHG